MKAYGKKIQYRNTIAFWVLVALVFIFRLGRTGIHISYAQQYSDTGDQHWVNVRSETVNRLTPEGQCPDGQPMTDDGEGPGPKGL